jgi:uncharacterized protein (DUF433 family)
MATTKLPPSTSDAEPDIERYIVQDAGEPGRHNARFVEYGDHVYAVLNALRRETGDAAKGDIAQVAEEWDMSEEAVRAAVAYYQQNRSLYDAYFLLQDEEWNAWNDR